MKQTKDELLRGIRNDFIELRHTMGISIDKIELNLKENLSQIPDDPDPEKKEAASVAFGDGAEIVLRGNPSQSLIKMFKTLVESATRLHYTTGSAVVEETPLIDPENKGVRKDSLW